MLIPSNAVVSSSYSPRDRLYPFLWKPVPIPVCIHKSDKWPFVNDNIYDQVVSQVKNDIDWLRNITGIDLFYDGFRDYPSEEGSIVISYLTEAEFEAINPGGYWAVAITSPTDDSKNILKSTIYWNAGKVDIIEKFAGVLMHELCHSIGIEHYNGDYSIMNSGNMYLHYIHQSMPKSADLICFYYLKRGVVPAEPSIYNFGDTHAAKGIYLHIPCLRAFDNNLFQVTLRGLKEADGNWYLTANSADYRRTYAYNEPKAVIDGKLITIQVRFQERSNIIIAEEVSAPKGGQVKFVVKEVQ